MPDMVSSVVSNEGFYLDHAATTPLDARVLEAMLPYLRGEFANPASLHRPGQRARRAVETAREQVAAAIGAAPKEVVFTSGATEADNHALRAVAERRGGHIVTSQLEHAAVLSTCRALEREGVAVTYLAPDAHGRITPEAVAAALREDTALVALMLVNNETGVRTDVAAIGEIAHAAGALLFCDAVQGFGFEPLDVGALGADLLALSAHKVYGPKGAGALYARAGLELPPLLLGGSQERGLRAGTHNVPAIVGFGRAAELALERLPEASLLGALRDGLEVRLKRVPGVRVNGEGAPRGPKHLNLWVSGVDGESLLVALDAAGLYLSAGSACAAGSLEPSHVLLAMGLSRAEAKASVRFSLGLGLRERDLDEIIRRFTRVVGELRRLEQPLQSP